MPSPLEPSLLYPHYKQSFPVLSFNKTTCVPHIRGTEYHNVEMICIHPPQLSWHP